MKCQPPNSQTSAACAAVAVPNKPHCPRPPHFIPTSPCRLSAQQACKLEAQAPRGHRALREVHAACGGPTTAARLMHWEHVPSCPTSPAQGVKFVPEVGARFALHFRGAPPYSASRGATALTFPAHAIKDRGKNSRQGLGGWAGAIQRQGGRLRKRCALVQGGRQGPVQRGRQGPAVTDHSAVTATTDLR